MWTEVNDNTSIEKLMEDFGGFHDSCIVSVNYASGASVDENGGMSDGNSDEHTVSMVLHSQWKKPLEMFFSGVKKCCITGFRESYFCDIFGATLGFRTDLLGKTRDDKLIVWADWDDGNFDPKTHKDIFPLDNGNEVTYIIAEGLKYRFLENGSE